MMQEHRVESLNNCISGLQQQTCAQRLELQDAHHGSFESRTEQVRQQEESVTREKALRDTQIRSVHEMGEIKRAQELRVDEFSVHKLRESHDTTQRLTSQIEERQERMNCLSGSGECQEVESNFCGKFSHVPSQPALIPSPRSSFDSTQTPYQGILHFTTPSATGAVPVHVRTGTPVARDEERIGSTIPMPMSARMPSTMNSFLPAEVPQNSLAVQQRQQISLLQFDK